MGARPEDYERQAPFKSYIHVDQFAGVIVVMVMVMLMLMMMVMMMMMLVMMIMVMVMVHQRW